MNRSMKKLSAALGMATVLGLGAAGMTQAADGKSLTLCWADRKSTRLNSSHIQKSRMPSSA